MMLVMFGWSVVLVSIPMMVVCVSLMDCCTHFGIVAGVVVFGDIGGVYCDVDVSVCFDSIPVSAESWFADGLVRGFDWRQDGSGGIFVCAENVGAFDFPIVVHVPVVSFLQ